MIARAAIGVTTHDREALRASPSKFVIATNAPGVDMSFQTDSRAQEQLRSRTSETSLDFCDCLISTPADLSGLDGFTTA